MPADDSLSMDQISALFPQLENIQLVGAKGPQANFHRHPEIQFRSRHAAGGSHGGSRSLRLGSGIHRPLPHHCGTGAPGPSARLRSGTGRTVHLHHFRTLPLSAPGGPGNPPPDIPPGGAQPGAEHGGRPADAAPEKHLSRRHHAQTDFPARGRRRRPAAAHQHLSRAAPGRHGGLRLSGMGHRGGSRLHAGHGHLRPGADALHPADPQDADGSGLRHALHTDQVQRRRGRRGLPGHQSGHPRTLPEPGGLYHGPGQGHRQPHGKKRGSHSSPAVLNARPRHEYAERADQCLLLPYPGPDRRHCADLHLHPVQEGRRQNAQ